MSKPCSWFRCEDDGEIDLIGLVSSTNPLVHASPLDMPPLGEVCSKHYLELRDTLALYRAGNMARQTGRALFVDPDPLTPPKMALVAVNPNECAECGHSGTSHYMANHERPRGCYACDAEGKRCPAWTAPA